MASAVSLMLWCQRGNAAPPPPSADDDVDLVYDVANVGTECPSRAELLNEIRARVSTLSPHGAADQRHFVVKIEKKKEGSFSGQLEVQRGAGHDPETRSLNDVSCRALSAAFVVFIAIALDPSTNESPEPAVRTEERPSLLLEIPSDRFPRRVAAHAAKKPAWAWSSGAGVAYRHASRGASGARVHAELAYLGGPSDLVAPSLRLSYGFTQFDMSIPNGGDASFDFRTARALGCARFDLSPIALSSCAGLDFGTLTAKSRDIPRVGSSSTNWYALSAAGVVSWSLLPWLALEAEVGLAVPFTRATYALADPIRVVYRAPTLVFDAGGGLALSGRFF